MTDDEIRAILMNMFSDKRFVRVPNSRRLYSGTVDGEKLGVVVATYNSSFGNFTLNCGEFKRLIDAKASGRIHHACVVKAKYDPETHQRKVVEATKASRAEEMLRDAEPRDGSYGPFWTLADSDVIAL
jgi:hypothetical protein